MKNERGNAPHPAGGVPRRRFLRDSAAFGLGVAAPAVLRAAVRDREARPPNIVFLLTDDQRWDAMGCAGNPIIQTPEMDRLAREGCRFTNAFVTTSICAASRASIFTGLYERTHRFTFRTPPLASRFIDFSYPVVLRQAGYRTGFVGKFGVGAVKSDIARMFDVFEPLHRTPYVKKLPDGRTRHLTDITGDKAVEFLRSCRPDQPFCLSVSFNAPHAEDRDPRQYIWPESVNGLYEDVDFPLPETADPAFFDQLPPFLKASLNRVRWHWRFETPEMRKRMIRGYYRMITAVDRVIGRIRRELARLGFDRNTVIVFTSDNGYFLGERGFAGKWLGYEPSLRVPLIVYDPALPSGVRGRTVDAMALNIDIAPTLVEYAGCPVPAQMQGRSLRDVVRGRSVLWRSDFFCEHLFEHAQIPKFEGVRTLRWKYLRYFQQKPVYEELYDLDNDPDETHNLIHEPAFKEVADRLRRRCDELRDRYGGPYRPWPRTAVKKTAGVQGVAGYAAGVLGKAARFDGRHFVKACRLPELPPDEAFSWTFFVRVDPACPEPGVIVGNRRVRKAADCRTFMKVTRASVQFFNGDRSVRVNNAIPPGAWHHVAVVHASGRVRVYMDGRRVGDASIDFAVPARPFYLGGDPVAHEMAVCLLDEVRLYRRALKDEEVARLARAGDVPEGLWGRWPFDGELAPHPAPGAGGR